MARRDPWACADWSTQQSKQNGCSYCHPQFWNCSGENEMVQSVHGNWFVALYLDTCSIFTRQEKQKHLGWIDVSLLYWSSVEDKSGNIHLPLINRTGGLADRVDGRVESSLIRATIESLRLDCPPLSLLVNLSVYIGYDKEQTVKLEKDTANSRFSLKLPRFMNIHRCKGDYRCTQY